MARSLGSSAGISIVQAMLIRDAALAHVRLSERITTSDAVLRSGLPGFMQPSSELGLQALNGEVTRQGTMISYDNVFSWIALSIVLLVPLILMLKPALPVGTEREVAAD
jgi:DHA2 family multidrug resistance protein